MSGYRYFAQRLTGRPENDEILDLDLPLQEVKITEVLSGPNRISAKISPKIARLIQDDGRPLITKWNTAIFAESSDGELQGFIVDDAPLDGPTISISGFGFCGYPQGQPYTESWSGVEVDPLDVVRQAWTHLQDQYNGNLGMEVSTAQSPIRIGIKKTLRKLDPQDDPNVGPSYFESGPARLAWYETDDIGAYLDKLASETPFDYGETHWWDGETLRRKLDLYYPRRGYRRDDLRFVVGENVTHIPAITSDEYATEVLALGAGEGRTMLHSTQSRPWAGLRRAVTVVDKSARTMAAVNGLARRELAWRVGLEDIADLIVEDHPNAPFHASAPTPYVPLSVGDEIYVSGRTEWSDIGHWVRVLEKEKSPEQLDIARLTVVRSDKLGDPHPFLTPITEAEAATSVPPVQDPASVPLGYNWRYKFAPSYSSDRSQAAVNYDDSTWKVGPSPWSSGHPDEYSNTNGYVWNRIKIKTLGGDLKFFAKQVDDRSNVYLDGVLIWSPSWNGFDANHTLIKTGVAAGEHTIAVYGWNEGSGGYWIGFEVYEQPVVLPPQG